jgi:hypothetical protein
LSLKIFRAAAGYASFPKFPHCDSDVKADITSVPEGDLTFSMGTKVRNLLPAASSATLMSDMIESAIFLLLNSIE